MCPQERQQTFGEHQARAEQHTSALASIQQQSLAGEMAVSSGDGVDDALYILAAAAASVAEQWVDTSVQPHEQQQQQQHMAFVKQHGEQSEKQQRQQQQQQQQQYQEECKEKPQFERTGPGFPPNGQKGKQQPLEGEELDREVGEDGMLGGQIVMGMDQQQQVVHVCTRGRKKELAKQRQEAARTHAECRGEVKLRVLEEQTQQQQSLHSKNHYRQKRVRSGGCEKVRMGHNMSHCF
jgi:hypothetical protein